MFICLLNAILSGYFEDATASKFPYIGQNAYTTPVYALRNFFTYFVLFNTMIPISLWVTLELVKVGQAKFMEWDDEMKTEYKTDMGHKETGCKAKTSNLNEELGRVRRRNEIVLQIGFDLQWY
jgi:magnesium-transporting ATPase (P-type)